MKTLADLNIGRSARIAEVKGEGALRRRLLDMGLIKGAMVTVIKVAPMGDPIELSLRGYSVSIRREDANEIIITETEGEKR